MASHAPDLVGRVVAVHRDDTHRFSKPTVASITLIAGLGVDGDAHLGATVQHRSRLAADPTRPNLRQVHLVAQELLDELRRAGHDIGAGDLGENVTTSGIDLVGLPVGTVLRFGDDALVAVTGLRNPCRQIEAFDAGLLDRMFVDRNDTGPRTGRTGVMGVVIHGGVVAGGDDVLARFPAGTPQPLRRV